MEEKSVLVSRRKVLTMAGMLGAGAVLAQPAGLALKTSDVSPEKWPWPYEKLDPTKTAELAYSEWYRLYCGGAVISSVFTQLREKVGKPYTQFPIDAFI